MASEAIKKMFLQRMFERRKAKLAGDEFKKIAGSQAIPEQTAPYQQSEAEMFPGEAPIQGLMTVEQEAQPATGLFQGLSAQQVPQMQAVKEMISSGSPLLQEQGMSMLDSLQEARSPSDVSTMRTFAMGAPENIIGDENVNKGKMIRARLAGNDRGFETLGTPYDPRNPYINTGTEFTNYNRPDAEIPINLQAAEQQKQLGKSGILSRFKQIDELKATEGGRAAGMKKAKYFYDKLAKGGMSSGGMRMILSYLPFTFTEQGRMDEEFNAFAETAARQALKASGEIRPTDADVTGMKKAMFGIGRDEQVNIRLLQNFMDSIKRDDHRAYLVESAKQYKKSKENVSPSGVTFTVK